MQIFIMRHGQAQQVGKEDSQRALTSVGENEVSTMAKWFNNEQLNVSHLFVSPYVRAQQTANIMLASINCSPEVSTLDFITPMDTAKSFHDYLDGIVSTQKIENILVVSHMPLVSYLVASLTSEKHTPIFQTAGIAQIEYNVSKMVGRLEIMTSPSDLI